MCIITSRYKSGFVIVLFLTILCQYNSAQTFTDRIKEVKSFKAGQNTWIEVNNKYGKVQIMPWKKDSVRIEAELFVSSNNLGRMEKTKNNISFEFTATNYYITARTNFSSIGNQLFQDLKGLSGNILAGKGTVEINYTIYCPLHINLSITNKFGNIFIDDLKGELKLSLSNGDLKINNHEGNAQIELNFGTAIINSVSDARFSLSYSDLRIMDAGKLTLDTKSSTINVDKCKFIRTSSRRDKYFLTNVNSLNVNGYFSQYWIEKLTYEADVQLKYGSFNITWLPEHVCNLNLTSEYADLNLTVGRNVQYKADILHHPDANVILPFNIKENASKTKPENSNFTQIEYTRGVSGPGSVLRVNATQKCNIQINEK